MIIRLVRNCLIVCWLIVLGGFFFVEVKMKKHQWMTEVVDDLTFYAVANELSDVAEDLRRLKARLEGIDGTMQTSNVVNLEFKKNQKKGCA